MEISTGQRWWLIYNYFALVDLKTKENNHKMIYGSILHVKKAIYQVQRTQKVARNVFVARIFQDFAEVYRARTIQHVQHLTVVCFQVEGLTFLRYL